MCGLVGVYGYIGDEERALFQDLLDLDIIRGHHSTGVAFIPEDDTAKPVTIKDTVFPYELMRRDDFLHQINQPNLALIGHNRAATRGEVNVGNAHPFTHGDITLAHNGTLTGKWRLPDQSKFDTDSEALCHSVNLKGIDSTYEILEGAAALSWWDDDNYTMNLITNGDRPLHVCAINYGATVVWSSSNDVLKTCVHRRGFKPMNNAFYKMTDHQLFTFSVDEHGMVKEETRKLTPFRYQYQTKTKFINGHSVTYETPWQKAEAKKKEEKVDDKSYYFEVPRLSGEMLTKDRFTEMFEHVGCVFCGESVKDEYGLCTVIDPGTVACEDCSGTARDFGIEIA